MEVGWTIKADFIASTFAGSNSVFFLWEGIKGTFM
jgi:hypothetical protein